MRTESFTGTIDRIFMPDKINPHTRVCHFFLTEPELLTEETFSQGQTYKIEALNQSVDLLKNIKPGDTVKARCWIKSKPVYKAGVIDYNAFIRLKSLVKITMND